MEKIYTAQEALDFLKTNPNSKLYLKDKDPWIILSKNHKYIELHYLRYFYDTYYGDDFYEDYYNYNFEDFLERFKDKKFEE